MSSLANLLEANLNKRDNGLGDRSIYVGASETTTCEMAMYFSKIQKKEYSRSLKEIIVLNKGNIAEMLLEWGFEGLKYNSQVECQGKGEYSFIKAHADFVVHFPKEDVVVEVKTTNDIPDSIRESWYRQTQVQMGLLGIKRAKVFAMNLNYGYYKEYDVVFNDTIYKGILNDMKTSWDKIHNNPKDIKGKVSPLCAFCSFKTECKTFQTNNVLPEEIEKMALMIKEYKRKIKVLEENVRYFSKVSGWERAKGKKVVIEFKSKSAKKLDFAKLKTEYKDVYEKCLYESSFETMNIY